MDDEPYVTLVDDLAGLLAHAAIDRVLAEFGTQVREEDPIVHFYETFLAQYNPRLREQRGVYYTPTPVVDYIVRSVDALLKRDFGLADGLGDTQKTTVTTSDDQGQPRQISAPRLLITDPATGTGTFPYQIIRLLRQRYQEGDNAGQWPAFVRDHLIHALYGFELMMAPYAIAHLKLSMELGGLDLPDETPAERQERDALSVSLSRRLNVYLTNTLEDPQHEIQPLPGQFRAISEEAQAAGKIKADYPIMVVLGNPPYSGHSANKNDWIDDLLKGTVRIAGKVTKAQRKSGNYYEVDGQPLGERNPKWLQDDYVKFIRWAQWRIDETGAGIVAFITPHGYLDNPTFRGMRQSLTRTFDDIYVLDLHGNANKKEKAPDGSQDQNVFDIRTGVAIGIFVRRNGAPGPRDGQIHRTDLWSDRENKYQWLAENDVLAGAYQQLKPSSPMYLWADQDAEVREEYERGFGVDHIMSTHSVGIVTGDDQKYLDFSNSVFSYYMLYRPFDIRSIDYTNKGIKRPRRETMSQMLYGNMALVMPKSATTDLDITITENIAGHKSCNLYNINSLFPLYLYPTPGENTLGLTAYDFPVDAEGRTPNLSKKFIGTLTEAISLTFAPDGETNGNPDLYTPEDVFHYIYAVLHSPSYRARYAGFLRTDFPRIPLPDSAERFRALAGLGAELAGLHLLRTAPKLGGFPRAGENEVAKGYPKYTPPAGGESTGKVLINPQQWFTGVPPEVWSFRVGGYQPAEKWLKDRRERVLSFEDVQHYQRTLGALAGTIRLLQRVDETAAGLWPDSFSTPSLGEIRSYSKREIADLLGITQKALDNIELENSKDRQNYIASVGETVYRLQRFVPSGDYLKTWMNTPNTQLDGERPLNLILGNKLDELLTMLDRVEDSIG